MENKIRDMDQLRSWITAEVIRLRNLRKNATRLQDTDIITGRIQVLQELAEAIK